MLTEQIIAIHSTFKANEKNQFKIRLFKTMTSDVNFNLNIFCLANIVITVLKTQEHNLWILGSSI